MSLTPNSLWSFCSFTKSTMSFPFLNTKKAIAKQMVWNMGLLAARFQDGPSNPGLYTSVCTTFSCTGGWCLWPEEYGRSDHMPFLRLHYKDTSVSFCSLSCSLTLRSLGLGKLYCKKPYGEVRMERKISASVMWVSLEVDLLALVKNSGTIVLINSLIAARERPWARPSNKSFIAF